MKRKVLIIVVFICCIIILLNFDRFKHTNKFPIITLKGNSIININLGDKYYEDGYKVIDAIDGNITDKVVIKHNINYSKTGTYEIKYEITNSKGITMFKKRFVIINPLPTYKDTYDSIDNTPKGWGTKNKKDGSRSIGNIDIATLRKYNAYYLGPDTKTIYLTFDEGSNDTYLKEIVDILNNNNVKATFFFCKSYILNNKDLMVNIVNNGHSVGNHTANHYLMPLYANKNDFSKYLKELKDNEDAFYNVTKTNMDKIYREPKGEYSFRSLQIIKDLGYKSYFWSASYNDYEKNVTANEALNFLKTRRHNGAIYLIHPKNKGNYLAMDSFIKDMKKDGYKFDLVKNINF